MKIPKYKCHKEVGGLKIKAIGYHEGTIVLIPENEQYEYIKVSSEYMEKHKPKIGGYYVRYEDGYESYSPSDVFEDGYTLIDDLGELTYEERIEWFYKNYYETGMELNILLDSMRNENLDCFNWYGDTIKLPKYKDEIN